MKGLAGGLEGSTMRHAEVWIGSALIALAAASARTAAADLEAFVLSGDKVAFDGNRIAAVAAGEDDAADNAGVVHVVDVTGR